MEVCNFIHCSVFIAKVTYNTIGVSETIIFDWMISDFEINIRLSDAFPNVNLHSSRAGSIRSQYTEQFESIRKHIWVIHSNRIIGYQFPNPYCKIFYGVFLFDLEKKWPQSTSTNSFNWASFYHLNSVNLNNVKT